MGKEAWPQFLVVAIFMNPAQRKLDGQPVELNWGASSHSSSCTTG